VLGIAGHGYNGPFPNSDRERCSFKWTNEIDASRQCDCSHTERSIAHSLSLTLCISGFVMTSKVKCAYSSSRGCAENWGSENGGPNFKRWKMEDH